MAYETGTASDLDDLLDKMVDFAVTNAGFTEITQIGGTGKQSDMYILQKGSIYWWFLGDSTSLSGYGTNGWLSMRMMDTTPTLVNYQDTNYAQYYDTRAQLWNRYDGPYTNYFFYSNGSSVQVVVEITPGVFTHWSFGVVDKFGTWTGGEFVTGAHMSTTAWNAGGGYWRSEINNYGCSPFNEGQCSHATYNGLGYVYYPQGSYGDYRDFAPTSLSLFQNQRARMGVPWRIETNTTYLYNYNLIDILLYCSPNTFNSRAALFPTYLHLYDQTSQRYHLLGHIENVKVLNMELLDPKDIVELEWDVYPFFQKVGDNAVSTISGNIALAYKNS
jgi:hypothetical protein